MPGAGYVEELVTFSSGSLQLEGVLAYPAESKPNRAVLLLAPHPQMGGNMNNNVIEHVARHAAEHCPTLRFNYRGVGKSAIDLPTGISLFDHWTQMEEDQNYDDLLTDARNALGFLRAAVPETAEIIVIGYSLGAILAGMLETGGVNDKVAAIAPPNAKAELKGFQENTAAKLFVAGTEDFAFDRESFLRDYASYPEPKAFVEIAGADHFFRMQEQRVYAAIAPFIFNDEERTCPK